MVNSTVLFVSEHHKKKQAEKEQLEQTLAAAAASRRVRPGRASLPRVPIHANIRSPGIRHEPYPISRPLRTDLNSCVSGESVPIMSVNSNIAGSSVPIVKTEPSEQGETVMDKTQNSSQGEGTALYKGEDGVGSISEQDAKPDSESEQDSNVSVKLEAVNEEELELEITGVEPGSTQATGISNVSLDMSYASALASGSQADISGHQAFSKCSFLCFCHL